MGHSEANAAGVVVQAGVVEQLVGLGDVEVVARNVGGVELRVGLVDRAGCDLAEPVEHVLQDDVLVDRVGDRLAYRQPGEIGVVQIEFDGRDVGAIAIACRLDAERRVRLQPCQISERHRIVAAEIDFARLEGDGAGGRIGDETDDDPVEIWLALVPVVRIAVEDHVAGTLPFLEHERPGSDRGPVVRVDGWV